MRNNAFSVCIFVLTLMTTSFRWPVDNGRITSTFGESRWDHFHDGVDMIAPDNKIYPVASGRLIFSWDRSIFPLDNYPGGGNYKIIEHTNGVYSLYLHLADGISLHQRYREDDLLGMIGNTGHSFGKHLHFSLLKIAKGISLNPFIFLPQFRDEKEPQICSMYIRIDDRYFLINENSNIRLTQHYPLLIDISDSIEGKESLGIYKLNVLVNGKKTLDVDFSQIGFSKNGLTIWDKTFHDLFDEKGYYKVKNINYSNGINQVRILVSDYAGNSSTKEISFNVKLELEQK